MLQKVCPEYPTLLIGEDGTVTRMASSRLRLPKHNIWQEYPEKELRQSTAGRGYLKVSCKNGPKRDVYVHHLVYMAFHGPIPSGIEINHKDGNKTNNHWTNLEALSRDDHYAHTKSMGRFARSLTKEQVLAIRDALEKGRTRTELAAEYGVDYNTVSRIHLGQTWSWLNDEGVQTSKG